MKKATKGILFAFGVDFQIKQEIKVNDLMIGIRLNVGEFIS